MTCAKPEHDISNLHAIGYSILLYFKEALGFYITSKRNCLCKYSLFYQNSIIVVK